MPKVMPAEAEAYQSPQLRIDYLVKLVLLRRYYKSVGFHSKLYNFIVKINYCTFCYYESYIIDEQNYILSKKYSILSNIIIK